MCKVEGGKDYNIGNVALTSSTLINISGTIEQIPSGGLFYFKEAIHLSAKEGAQGGGYKKDGINMLLNANELKALSYAMKEFVRIPTYDNTKKSNFEKISNSGTMKKVYLGFTMPNNYYINVKVLDKNNPKTIAIKSDKYKFLAYADSIFLLAQEVEKSMFAFERKKDKIIKQLEANSGNQ